MGWLQLWLSWGGIEGSLHSLVFLGAWRKMLVPRATVSRLVVVLEEEKEKEFWLTGVSKVKQEHISAGGEP